MLCAVAIAQRLQTSPLRRNEAGLPSSSRWQCYKPSHHCSESRHVNETGVLCSRRGRSTGNHEHRVTHSRSMTHLRLVAVPERVLHEGEGMHRLAISVEIPGHVGGTQLALQTVRMLSAVHTPPYCATTMRLTPLASAGKACPHQPHVLQDSADK